MKELKSFVKKHEKPLQQVVNRYNEKCYANSLNISNLRTNNQQFIQKPELKHMHANGPLVKNVTAGSLYYTLLYKRLKIKIKPGRDSFILTKNKEVV